MVKVALLAAVVLLAAACSSGDGNGSRAVEGTPDSSPIPRPGTTSECPNAARATTDGRARGGSLTGDIDGDGSDDRVFVAVDADGPEGCKAFVVVRSAAATHVLDIDQEGMSFDLGLPQLKALVQIDRRDGLDIVVDLVAGASTQFAGVFTMGGGPLERLRVGDDASAAQDLFAYGGSVGHIDGVDCVEGGKIVTSSAVPSGDSYMVTRRFLELDQGMLVPTRASRDTAPLEELQDRFPELGGAPFARCSPAPRGAD